MPILTALAASKTVITFTAAGAIALGGGAAAFTTITSVDTPPAVTSPSPSGSPTGAPSESPTASPSAPGTPAPAPTASAPAAAPPASEGPAPEEPAVRDDEKAEGQAAEAPEDETGTDEVKPVPATPEVPAPVTSKSDNEDAVSTDSEASEHASDSRPGYPARDGQEREHRDGQDRFGR